MENNKKTFAAADVGNSNPFEKKTSKSAEATSQFHKLKGDLICDTEKRGFAKPEGRSELELVVNASEGFIALWDVGVTLRWRFQERSFANFVNPDAAKDTMRGLFGEALMKWAPSVPVKFTEDIDVWDFEIVVKSNDDCTPNGCVLAKAFFPDAGRHELIVYPKMFTQSKKEQVDTLIHELGHVFGLRHFFAKLWEAGSPSEIFGKHNAFSIMNYGEMSELTEDDKSDLQLLYRQARSGALTDINGTPIKLVKPFSASAPPVEPAFAVLASAFRSMNIR